jgi:ABC-type dipeptide/oligopeptide/nickel transport system ATPase component
MSSKPDTASSTAVLEATDLDVVYPLPDGDVTAVKDFHIAIRESEFVGLVGESGSGKSTAALALMALVRIPGRIARGRVCFKGEDLLAKTDAELRSIRGREIGLIVQNSRSALNPLVSVGDQIANVYRAHHDVSARDAYRLAVQSIKEIGIPDAQRRATSYPHQLSGGMAQRILIAMATINEPRLLIADEPTTGLDVTVQAQFLDALDGKIEASRSAVLFVTHDLGVVAQYCDRVAVMHQGKVIEEADVRTLFAQPKHPYTQRLVASAADRGTRRRASPTEA